MAEPTLDNVMGALRKADQRASDEDRPQQEREESRSDARRLAQIAQQMRQQQPQSDRSFTDLSPSEMAQGVVETGLAMGSGAIAEPLAGYAGTGRLLYDAVRGRDNAVSQAADTVEAVRRNLTFQPRSEAGQVTAETAAVPAQWIEKGARTAGIAGMEATPVGVLPEGSPAVVGTGIQTAIEGGPMGIVSRPMRAARLAARRRRDVGEAERFARQEGISLRQRGPQQREQIAQAGMRRADDERARSMEGLAQAVSSAREAENATINQLFERARASNAGVRVGDAADFVTVARRSLRDFDVGDMPKVRRRLRELQGLRRAPENAEVSLNTIDKWRRRINKNRSSDPAENAALNVLKAQADNYLEDLFVTDMIRGDPSALAKWQEARGAFQRFKETFDDDRVIRDFATAEATPEEFRRFLFGASVTGAKKQASQTVRKLKDIVGEDSAQFRALRDDALVDVMEPLMRENPSASAFVTSYDRFVRNNPSLSRELFTDQQLGELKRLRDMAAANVKRGDPPPQRLLSDMPVVFALGHGIARGGARVALGRRFTQGLRESRNKKRFLGELFDYDPNQSVVPSSAVAVGGAQQASERQGRQLERQRRLRGRQ